MTEISRSVFLGCLGYFFSSRFSVKLTISRPRQKMLNFRCFLTNLEYLERLVNLLVKSAKELELKSGESRVIEAEEAKGLAEDSRLVLDDGGDGDASSLSLEDDEDEAEVEAGDSEPVEAEAETEEVAEAVAEEKSEKKDEKPAAKKKAKSKKSSAKKS